MTPERWQEVKRIAGDALAMAAADRDAYVERACAGDRALGAEVASLLAAEDPTGAFLDIDRPPDRIGAYRIVGEIGRGGMGVVYLGERADGEFEQRAAIKIVKRGMDSAAVLRRFVAERRILATLQHPNIARLLDGGMTPDGRPYFVMEYLAAEPLTAYCRRKTLGLADRLELMATVCDVVEYAHRHLVLHRDLKDGNILVGDDGAPKLLDFGIAKLLAVDEGAGAPMTEAGQRALTPQSSSPEQIRGEPLTTATDIYSLGLLTYELIAGTPPYHVPLAGPIEQARTIAEARPKRPSAAAVVPIARRIRADLDTVVMKAIEKEPADRYARAADLGEDLRRVWQGLPILARPATVVYRARKYASRNWRGLAIAATLAAIVSWAVADALVQGRRAERHFREVRALANSFLFEFHDAIAKLPGSTPARALVLTRALEYLDRLSREAATDVDLKKELAESYLRVGEAQGLYYESNLGKTMEARASFDKAVALFADVARARPSDAAGVALANARLRLASTYQATDPARARALIDEAIGEAGGQAAEDSREPRRALTLGIAQVALAENGKSSRADAAAARERAIGIFRRLATTGPDTAEARRFLSISLKRRAATAAVQPDRLAGVRGDLAEAAAIDEQRVLADPADAVAKLDLALGQGYLAAILQRGGDLDGASAALARAMETRQGILRADPQNLRVRTQLIGDCIRLAAISQKKGRPDEMRAAIATGQSLASAVTGSAAANPDFQTAVAELSRIAARQP